MQKVKVFISSTFKDLQHYRTEVDKTIRVLDSESISMEHFGSDHRKPLEVCLRAIDDCELFVGIYALRYGFIPPNETRSITELEYHHAVAQGKTILAFVAKDAIQYETAYVSDGVSTDPDDIKKLHAFKTQIGLDRVIREFVTIDELGKYMAIELGKYYVKIIRGKTLSNPIAPLSLPKGIFYPIGSPYVGLRYFSRQEAKVFYGRNQLIFDLYKALQKDEPIVLVYGQTGVGKSSVLEAGLLPRMEAQGWEVKTLRRQKELGLPLQWQEAIHPWNAPKRLLVIDQAEELWTLPNPSLATEKQDFFAALRLLIDSYDPNGKLIISFRKEFLAEMETGLREQNLPHLKVLVKPMNQPELMEAITQVQDDKDAYDRYRINIHEDLPHEMAYDLRRDDQSHLAPLLQATLSRMWALARTENPDGELTFDQALYDRVKTESLEAFLHEQLHQIAQHHPEAVQSGLVLDLLHYLTTEMGTAAQCTLTELHARYPHVGQLETLVASCENAYLLLKPTPQTLRLSHDALAPLVQKAYRLSDAPGPTAARILEAKDLKQNTDEHFTEAELETLQAGRVGMRLWNETEEKAVAQTQAQVSTRKRQAQAQQKAILRALSNGLAKDAKLATEQKAYSQAARLAEKAWEVDKENWKAQEALINFYPTLRSLGELQGHTKSVNSAIFSPDGKLILTASYDHTARLWNAHGKTLAVLEGHTDRVTSAIFSPDGQRILTASDDHTARLWDAHGKTLAVLEGHTKSVTSAIFSPNGKLILTASYDPTARLWNAHGKTLAVLEGHKGINSAIFSPDGQRILTASLDNTVRLWDPWDAHGKTHTVLEGHTDWVTSAIFSPDGQRILTASRDKTARLWDAHGKTLAVLEGHTKSVNSAIFSPNGKLILTASYDPTARLWNAHGKTLAVLEGHKGINSAIFSPDGQRILTASDDTARLWDAQGKTLAVLEGHTKSVNSAIFSPDGQRILTASYDHTARLWDAQGKILTVLKGQTNRVTSAIFSPDGQRILTMAFGDKTALLWDAQGKVIAVLEGHTDWVTSAIFSPDGQRILTASRDKTTRLWDAQGKTLAVLEGHTDWVTSAIFSPDGQRILTASYDHTARLWDAQGKILTVLEGQTNRVTSAIFSPDGQRILTMAFGDKTALLWDAQGKVIAVLEGHTNWVTSAIFSPDGQRILTASRDKTARLWELDPFVMLRDVDERHICVLTWQELKQYDIDNMEKAAGINRVRELLEAAPHEMKLYHYARYYYEIARLGEGNQEEYCQKALLLYDKLIDFFPLQHYQAERELVQQL